MANPLESDHATRFGERRVAEEEKGSLVRAVFRNVAPRYDLMNDLMSAGVHRIWKRTMVSRVAEAGPGMAVDVAGGTGDIAFRLKDRGFEVAVVDINDAMLGVGRDRALDRAVTDGITWTCGDAEALPLRDSSVDAYTIAFGIRNVTHLDRALAEDYSSCSQSGASACAVVFDDQGTPFFYGPDLTGGTFERVPVAPLVIVTDSQGNTAADFGYTWNVVVAPEGAGYDLGEFLRQHRASSAYLQGPPTLPRSQAQASSVRSQPLAWPTASC